MLAIAAKFGLYVSLFEISQTVRHYCRIMSIIWVGLLPHTRKDPGGRKTWQDISTQPSGSVLGPELHERLTTKANAGGGWIEYSWGAGGMTRRRRRGSRPVPP